MSISENISLYKKRSKIDYMPLFVSLWLSLNMWMKDRWNHEDERDFINSLKELERESLINEFIRLLVRGDEKTITFRLYFAELHRALENSELEYDKNPNGLKKAKNKKLSFSNCVIKWKNGNFETVSFIKPETEQEYKTEDDRIEIDLNFSIKNEYNDLSDLFAAYIEILYQVRNILFHGKLDLTKENERVIKYLYLTLSMIMEKV